VCVCGGGVCLNDFVRVCLCWDGLCLCVVRVCVFPVLLCVYLF